MTSSLPSPERVAAAIRGDALAFEAVVRASLPVVLGWCKRLSGPSVDFEDAAHDILVVVVDRLSGLRDPEAYSAWLFQITRKRLASLRRRAWFGTLLEQEPADTRLDPEAQHYSNDCSRRVQALLDELPEKQRIVLVLHDLEERSDAETAAMLGIPKGTVKSRLRLGRHALRKLAMDEGLWPRGLVLAVGAS
jgi:RNA polymerase sigma-70 factor (ECF subfamily)